MKIFALTFIISLSFASLTNATLNLSQKYSCTVTASSDPSIPIGTTTRVFSFDEMKALGGTIHLNNINKSISLYSRIETYDANQRNSGRTVFATNPTESKERHGSISVLEKSDLKLDLDISIFNTTRVYKISDGTPEFVFKNAPQLYKLSCDTK